MKLPKSVQILNSTYKIKLDKSVRDRNRCGECDLFDKEISLDPDLKGNSLAQTLMHEIIHAYQFESGIMQFMEIQACEMMAESLANLILSLPKNVK